MQTNTLKKTLRPQTGESPEAAILSVTGKMYVGGDGRYFYNNQTIYCYVYIPQRTTNQRFEYLRTYQQH